MAGAGLTPGKAESLPTDPLSNFIPVEVQRILTVEFPYLALCKIGFNFKRGMPRRRAFLLILTQRLTDTEKCLWSWPINRATRIPLNEINPYLLNHAFVRHFACFRLIFEELFVEYFGRWKRLIVGILAGVVEFRQISDGGTRARRLGFTFAARKHFSRRAQQFVLLPAHVKSGIRIIGYLISSSDLHQGLCSSQAWQSVMPETP